MGEERKGQAAPGQTQDPLKDYRAFLMNAAQKESAAYDQAVMTLSGGALGISITFIHDIAPAPKAGTIWLLGIAWCFLALSIAAILISKLTSQWALRKAIRQVDDGTIGQQRPGARFSAWTASLNVAAGMAFLLGVIFLACFTVTNVISSGATPLKHT
jgi:hypothetical protein